MRRTDFNNFSFKQPVRVATTANITLAAAQTIDGVSVVAGDRVLVKNQTNAYDNGIYVCQGGSWVRAKDAQSPDVKAGLACFISEGSVNGNTVYHLTTDDPITLGTTNLTFAQLGAAFAGGTSGLDGSNVKNVANGSIVGGVPIVITVDIADGVTGDTDVTLTNKIQVNDVVVEKRAGAGGASDTITVKNGSTAITNAMDINVADKAIVRAGTIDDAASSIAAAGTLRVTRTKVSGANVACQVRIHAMRVA